MNTFATIFGTAPAVVASAPGRVNLLGEHTDYNDGYVLPTAIPQTAVVSARINGHDAYRVYSANLDRNAEFTLERPPAEHFARYVYGCVRETADAGAPVVPLDVHIHSTVPMGVGLSSSAALEVALLRALRKLFGIAWDDVAIARHAQQAEIRYAGVHCGIMDQMASSLADTGHMLFLDTRTLERRIVPLPARSEVLIIDSGIPRVLANTAYNTRRDECERAARELERLFAEVGMPFRLSQLDIPREALDAVLANSLKNFNADPKREFIRERDKLHAALQAAWQ